MEAGLSTSEISLGLRAQIDSIADSCGHDSASHAFTSLFLWQTDMGLSVCMRERAFAVRCKQRGDAAWFFPCGEEKGVLSFVKDILERSPNALFLYLRREDVELLDRHFSGRFRIVRADDSSEYLFDRKEYVALPGEKNRSIRWSINHLKRHHDLRTVRLDPDNLNDARAVFSAWKPHHAGAGYAFDRTTAALLFDHYAQLDVTGVMVYMDGGPKAVAIGFPLSESVFDIAFSKAPVRETGILHYARRMLVKELPDRFTVINGEEDLGIPGLRRAKRLEHPIGMIEMFEAYAESE